MIGIDPLIFSKINVTGVVVNWSAQSFEGSPPFNRLWLVKDQSWIPSKVGGIVSLLQQWERGRGREIYSTPSHHGPSMGIYGCCLILQQSSCRQRKQSKWWPRIGLAGRLAQGGRSGKAVAKTRQGGKLREPFGVSREEAALMPCNAFWG